MKFRLEAQQQRLRRRLDRFGKARDGIDIWTSLGIVEPAEIPDLRREEFLQRTAGKRKTADDAR